MMQQQIDDLLKESSNIANEVRMQNWSCVRELTETRQRHLEELFANPIEPEYIEAVVSMTKDILHSDKELMALINQEQQRAINELTGLNNNALASLTYQHISNYS